MKLLLITILLFCFQVVNSQTLDSVRYANGYIFYHEYGKGEPVLILSGGPGVSCEQEEDVAIKLSEKYHSILLEQRGTGRSIPIPFDTTTINLETAISDINLLLNHLSIDKINIVGHSWGGTLALAYATTYPEKVNSLVLIAPGWYKILSTDDSQIKTTAYNKNVRLGISDLNELHLLNAKVESENTSQSDLTEIRKINNMGFIYDKMNIDAYFEKIKKGTLNNQMHDLMFDNLIKINFDLSEKLRQFNKQITIICGRQDPLSFMTYEYKLLMPSVQINWIQKCGHYGMFEQPKEFYIYLFSALEIKN